jgi:hypothetical protein
LQCGDNWRQDWRAFISNVKIGTDTIVRNNADAMPVYKLQSRKVNLIAASPRHGMLALP